MPCLIMLFGMLLAVLCPCPRCEEADPRSVEDLIARLGAESFDEREAASNKLYALGPAALPGIERHEATKDAELENRLADIREALHADLADDEFLPILGQLKKPAEIKRFKAQPGQQGSVGEAALEWLARTQSDDGHWDAVKYGAETNADLEQTALAALAFLDAGHTPKVGLFKANIKNALDWLKSRQRADGAYIAAEGAPVDALAHAIAALVMEEATGMTRLPEYKQSAQLGVDFSATLQQTTGSNRGGFARTEKLRPDLLTTTFFAMQFKSARVAGLKVPHRCFDGIIVFLDQLEDKERHAFRGRVDGPVSPSTTIMGCLSRNMLGWAREDLEPYFSSAMESYRGHVDGKRPDVLMNYFATMAAFLQGGEHWRKFNSHLHAVADYCRTNGEFEGSWDPAGVRGGIGRVATTAFLALSLEVYRR